MKNFIICHSCGSENPIYTLTCNKCKAYFRNRISNIDFWDSTWQLIESPFLAFKNIVYAEHKNFMLFLLFSFLLKFMLNSLTLLNMVFIESKSSNEILLAILFATIINIIVIFLFTFALQKINKSLEFETRYKDNLAILLYSQIPLLIGLVIFAPIEYALFGEYWFTSNPAPYIIKPMASYVIMGIEALLIIWSIILLAIGYYFQTRNLIYSIFIGLIFFGLFWGTIFLVI